MEEVLVGTIGEADPEFAVVLEIIEDDPANVDPSLLLEESGDVHLCFSEHWDSEERDQAEWFALSNQPRIKGTQRSNRSHLGWLGAAQGLTDVAIASELLRLGRSRRALVTASGLAGDIAAVVLEMPT